MAGDKSKSVKRKPAKQEKAKQTPQKRQVDRPKGSWKQKQEIARSIPLFAFYKRSSQKPPCAYWHTDEHNMSHVGWCLWR